MTKKLTSILVIMLLLTITVMPVSASECNTKEVVSVVHVNFESGKMKSENVTVTSNFERTDSAYANTENNTVAPAEIIGTDNRQIVLTTGIKPYSTIPHIVVEFPSGAVKHGTAVLFDDDTALTTAHCFYHEDSGIGEWANYVAVYPGQVNTLYPFGDTTGVEAIISSDFMQTFQDKDDWAVLKLADPIGNECGWSELKVITPVIGKQVKVIGYPYSSGTEGIMYESTGSMYESTGSMYLGSNNDRILHTADTIGGQSGAPVFDEEGYVIAIHQGGIDSYKNSSVRISETYKSIFESYK